MKPSHVKAALKFTVLQQQRPCMIWGPIGAGKSDIVAQLAEENNLALIDKRLAQSDPTEIKGYPWPDQTKKVMTFFRDEELPTKGKGILFLDELVSAPQAVQAVAYQLILNRRIGKYELPKGWNVIAAGNRMTDRSVVHAMPAALSNRFVHIDFVPDIDDWCDWAMKNGISDGTRGYLRYRPANLFTDRPEPGQHAFPSPRTWFFADRIIHSKLEPAVELELLRGTVGEGIAVEYMGFMREAKNLPNLDRILLNPDSVPVPDSPSTCHAIVAALEVRTTPSNFDTVLKYIKRMPKEFEVVFMSTMSRNGDEYCETQAMTDWLRENRSILR